MEIDELEKVVMEMKDKLDTILNAADESEKAYHHKKGLEEFTSRNGETLGKYVDKLKKLNGDDFDIYSAAFDEYSNDFSDIEESTYVAQLVSEIDNKLAKLKEALADDETEAENTEVEVKSDEDTTKVEAETEDGEKTEIETESEEPEKEEKEEEAEEKSEDELADFEADLEKDYEKFHK